MKIFVMALIFTISTSAFASGNIYKDEQGRCVVPYKNTSLAIVPKLDTDVPTEDFLEIYIQQNGEKVVYKFYDNYPTGDHVFVRVSGKAFTKYLVYDDYRGIAFTKDLFYLEEEVNFASYYRYGSDRLNCEQPHGRGQRHYLQKKRP